MNSSQSLIELLSDEHMLEILYATNETPKSITSLSKDFGISVTACYRRIELLQEMGIVRKDHEALSKKGRIIKLYRSNINKIDILFENGKMVFELSMDNGEKKNILRNVLTDKDIEYEPDPIHHNISNPCSREAFIKPPP